jgi:hypothetical protein
MLATMTQHRRSGDGDNDGAGSGKTADDEDDEETTATHARNGKFDESAARRSGDDLWTKGEVPDGDKFLMDYFKSRRGL